MVVTLYGTRFSCFKCGAVLLRVDPEVWGWRYYCTSCRHLTVPRREIEKQMAEKPDGAVGLVVAMRCEIDVPVDTIPPPHHAHRPGLCGDKPSGTV